MLIVNFPETVIIYDKKFHDNFKNINCVFWIENGTVGLLVSIFWKLFCYVTLILPLFARWCMYVVVLLK